MILDFCAACGDRDGLQQHHLLPQSIAESDDDLDTVTLCPEHHGMAHNMKGRIDASKLIAAAVRKRHAAGVRLGPKPPPASAYAPKTSQEALWVHLFTTEGLQAAEIICLRWCDVLAPIVHPVHRDIPLSTLTNERAADIIRERGMVGDALLERITVTEASATLATQRQHPMAPEGSAHAFSVRLGRLRKASTKRQRPQKGPTTLERWSAFPGPDNNQPFHPQKPADKEQEKNNRRAVAEENTAAIMRLLSTAADSSDTPAKNKLHLT